MSLPPELELRGLAVSPGIAIGRAVVLSDRAPEVLRFQLEEEALPAEIQRFEEAQESAHQEILRSQKKMREELGSDLAGIFEAQAMLLADETLVRAIRRRIRDEGVNAEWAILRTFEELEERFAAIETDYLRERGEDLRSVVRYLLQCLRGINHHEISEIEGNVVIVADELTPAEALRLARQRVVAFALETGGKTSHTAIIARGLNLPAVVGLEGITQQVTDESAIVLDGDQGLVVLHPTPQRLEDCERRRQEASGLEAELVRSRALASLTRDDVEIELLANLELPEEVDDALRFGCAGVGLYRSEFFYIEKSPEVPTEEEHYELLSGLLQALAPRPVVVRTLDLGGRKLNQALVSQPEENPVLGLRGIRLTLARPDILVPQLRALFRVALEGDLRIMIPLVTSLDEARRFLQVCQEVLFDLDREGVAHDPSVPLGAMLEVPAAALLADHFAVDFDFLSIGTNDLIQYSLAVDRNNEHVADLYEALHPSVLRLLETIAKNVEPSVCELSICGEMAADPVLTPFLLGLGLRRLSMSPRSIPIIKERVRSLEIQGLDETVRDCLRLGRASEVRQLLEERYPADDKPTGFAGA